MYAVDPAQVRANAVRQSPDETIDALQRLGLPRRGLVILSGGNPALHDLGPLVDEFHRMPVRVSVETQGSVWKPWLADVDRLVVSPKPPSSGMDTPAHAEQFERFMGQADRATLTSRQRIALKIVVADEADYLFARAIGMRYTWAPLYLSVMTPQYPDVDLDGVSLDTATREAIHQRYAWLCERVAADYVDAVVLPQLHVIAWGTRQGV